MIGSIEGHQVIVAELIRHVRLSVHRHECHIVPEYFRKCGIATHEKAVRQEVVRAVNRAVFLEVCGRIPVEHAQKSLDEKADERDAVMARCGRRSLGNWEILR